MKVAFILANSVDTYEMPQSAFHPGLHGLPIILFTGFLNICCTKQEGQVAQNRSPEFCLKLTYWYLLKAGHVPGDSWDGANFGPRGII